jgi:hypothetical protein
MSPSQEIECGICNGKILPEHLCHDCGVWLCLFCKVMHSISNEFRGHHIITTNNLKAKAMAESPEVPVPICPDHHEEAYLFCLSDDCCKAICIACKHERHQHHLTTSFGEKVRVTTKNLGCMAKNLTCIKDATMQSLDEKHQLLQEMGSCQSDLNNEIKDKFSCVRCLITQEESELVSTLNNAISPQRDLTNAEIRELEERLSALNAVGEDLQELLLSGSKLEQIKCEPVMQKKINKLFDDWKSHPNTPSNWKPPVFVPAETNTGERSYLIGKLDLKTESCRAHATETNDGISGESRRNKRRNPLDISTRQLVYVFLKIAHLAVIIIGGTLFMHILETHTRNIYFLHFYFSNSVSFLSFFPLIILAALIVIPTWAKEKLLSITHAITIFMLLAVLFLYLFYRFGYKFESIKNPSTLLVAVIICGITSDFLKATKYGQRLFVTPKH